MPTRPFPTGIEDVCLSENETQHQGNCQADEPFGSGRRDLPVSFAEKAERQAGREFRAFLKNLRPLTYS